MKHQFNVLSERIQLCFRRAETNQDYFEEALKTGFGFLGRKDSSARPG
jgi:hypothetical protein